MNVHLKIEVLKVFTLEFSMSSDGKLPKKKEDKVEEAVPKPHPGGIQ